MSYFDDASLAFLPSGAAGKDGKAYSIKPTDGTGDFTFSRGSNLAATRVGPGPNYYIEKGRENLLLRSNQFNTTWSNINITQTSGQTGYDGSSDAWKSSFTAGATRVFGQSFSQTGVVTISIYVKAGNHNFVQFVTSTNTTAYVNFDISSSSAAVGTEGTGVIDSNITSVGNDWYRCSMSFNNSSSGTIYVWMIDSATSSRASDVSTDGNILIQNAQLEIGLAATEVIESGATTGKAGILEDTPRFDYSGGATCPSLLLEPSRTNLVRSEYYGDLSLTRITLTSNYGISPEGVQNAAAIFNTTENGRHNLNGAYFAVTSGTSYVNSVFAKAGTITKIKLRLYRGGGTLIGFNDGDFDLTNGTATGTGAGIESYGNGWYRCYVVDSPTSSVSNVRFNLELLDANGGVGYVGSVTDYIEIYGSDISIGSYPTSYIPNHSGGTITRAADNLNNLGISSMLTSSSFTWFLDLNEYIGSDINQGAVFLESSLSSLNIQLRVRADGYRFYYSNIAGGSTYPIAGSTTAHKFCVSYDGNDYRLYVDGNLEATTTSVGDSGWDFIKNATAASIPLKQMLLFSSKLSDADCITLTT